MKPAEVKAAYSRLLKEFPLMVCSSKWLPPVSHDIVRAPSRGTLEYWLALHVVLLLSNDHAKSASSIYQRLELAVATAQRPLPKQSALASFHH
jgi:hypothetical protein